MSQIGSNSDFALHSRRLRSASDRRIGGTLPDQPWTNATLHNR
jgi:hypothetical protein